MARPSVGANLNIAQLEQILSQRKSAIAKLTRQRDKLQKKMDALDRQITAIGGDGARSGVRARNEVSLPEAMDRVLRASGKPMKVGDITDAVLASGYHSNSQSFRAIVNQTLIKESKRFVNSGDRGTYQLKK